MKQRSGNNWLVALLFGSLLIQDLAFANPVFVPQFLSGGTGRNIRHLPCVSRRTGETGICMFAFTCAKANGTHLGTCIDRFYFGSCCKIDEEPDIFPQDNTIDIDSSASLPKPYDTTTTTQTPESNDIPGNVDASKPSTKPNFQAESVATQSTESTTAKTNEPTKTKPSKLSTKKPIVTEFTTESIRLSTFQSVQNASEQHPITTPSSNTVVYTKRPQRPTIADQKPTASKPKPTSPPYLSINSTATIPSTTLSLSTLITGILSLKPVASTASSSPIDQQYVSSKRPATTVGLIQRPTSTLGTTLKPELVETTIPSYSTTPHRNVTSNIYSSTTNKLSTKKETELSSSSTTTQRTTSITRFPPRNATTVIPTTNVKLSNKPGNATMTTQKTTEASQKPLVTRKPSITTKKPVKVTTKRPPTVTKRPPLLTTTRRSTTLSSVTISSTSSNLTKVTSTLNPTTINAAANSSSSISTTIASTRRPATTIPTKRPATTRRPIVTTPPRITTRRPTITTLKRNFTSSISPRPTTTASTSLSPSTTHKPSTATHHAPSSVIANESGIETTTTKSTTPKIKNTTTAGTKVTQKPTTEFLEIPVVTSTAATVKDTTVSSTTAKSTTLSSTELNRNSSTESYTTSPTVITLLTNQKNSTISLSGTTTTSTIINEIDAEFNEMDQTTIVPGIVTWSSFSDEMENSTKIHESSSSVPDTAETEWTPITTPDGWIIIQSPTTESVASEEETEVKPILSTIAAPVTSGKPATESTTTRRTTTTTTQRVTTQPTTYVDMLSTLATVTVSPDFTEPPVESINMSNYKDVCGRRLFPEARIVGGDGSTFGKWPWQISLRQWRTTSYLHKCGAALLNENWAITAAHCVQNVLPTDLLLRMGEHDLGNEKEPYVFQERRVQIVASHPNFDPRTFEFDLALMRFYEPILPFQPNVLPICIPDDDEDHVGRTAFVTGWGRLYEDGPLPSVLQEVAVPIINNSVCEGMYRNAGYIEHIPHIFICAGWRKGGFDSCEGDSGGPLVIQRKRDKRWVLAGVISWGIGCAEPNQPGVYTRISEFREWINQILQF